MAGRDVSEAVEERAGQSTVSTSPLPAKSFPNTPNHFPAHFSLCAAVSFCWLHIDKVAFPEKVGKKLFFKATDAHIRSFNLFQNGVG